jgi:predicted metalloprotease with PDZ domain
MKKLSCLLALAVTVSFASTAFAGHGAKCADDAQACLGKWAGMKAGGWTGMKHEKGTDGTLTVTELVADGPAAKGGILKGDVLLSVNGASFGDKEALKKAKANWKPGDKVTYKVRRDGAESEVAVLLAPMPEGAFASMLGEHFVTNHLPAAAASAAAAPATTAAPASAATTETKK